MINLSSQLLEILKIRRLNIKRNRKDQGIYVDEKTGDIFLTAKKAFGKAPSPERQKQLDSHAVEYFYKSSDKDQDIKNGKAYLYDDDSMQFMKVTVNTPEQRKAFLPTPDQKKKLSDAIADAKRAALMAKFKG